MKFETFLLKTFFFVLVATSFLTLGAMITDNPTATGTATPQANGATVASAK